MNEVYVFDLDGTLVDSMPYFTRGILSILDEEGIPYDDGLIDVLTPLGYTKSAEYYVGMGVQAGVEQIVSRIEQKLVQAYTHDVRTKPGVPAYLRRLREEGARLFVLTASPHLVTDVCLKQNGIWDLFETVWSVEDFGLSKSEPHIFREVARRIGCTPGEIRFFDDNLTALENARLAGLRTFGVFDGQSEADLARMRTLSEAVVESFTSPPSIA